MIITDGTDDFKIYGVFSADGSEKYEALIEKPVVGDIVYLYGHLKAFFENLEMSNSWLVKMEKGEIPEFDAKDYTKMSIEEARQQDVDSKVIIKGVVSKITFANSMAPNGLFLVDETGTMYLFDYNIAVSVSEGDTIEVGGTRKNFILADETNQAAKLGYDGAIQLADASLISKVENAAEFDTTWIEERTIKDLL